MEQTKRIGWIDTTKAICIFSVILGHLYGYIPIFDTGLTINHLVFPYHLPALFLLSGFTLKKTLPDKTYINHKFSRLMKPYFITCFFIMLIDSFNLLIHREASIDAVTRLWGQDIIRAFFASGSRKNMAGIEMDSVIGAIWFLPAMFFALLLVQAVMNYIRDHRMQYAVLGTITFLAAILAKLIWLPFHILSASTGALFILIGYDMKESGFLDKIKPPHLIGLLAFFLWGLRRGYSFIVIVDNRFPDFALTILLSLAASILVFFLGKLTPKSRYLQFIGEHTLALLCIHLLDIETLGLYWNLLFQNFPLAWPVMFFLRLLFYHAVLLVILLFERLCQNRMRTTDAAQQKNIENGITPRDKSVDIMRGILITSMLIGHCPISNTLRDIIYSCHMTAFVFLSGYFFRETLPLNKQVKRMAKGLLLPYLIFCGAKIIVTSLSSGGMNRNLLIQLLKNCIWGISFSDKLFTDIGSIGPVWFLLLLFLVRLIYSVISSLCRNDTTRAGIVAAISLVGVCLGEAGLWLPWSLDVAMYCLIYYMAGHYFHKYKLLDKIAENYSLYFILSCLWAWMIYAGSMEIATRNYGVYSTVIIGSLSGTVLLYMLAQYLNAGRSFFVSLSVGVLSYAGRAAVDILIIHTLFSGSFYRLLVNGVGFDETYLYYFAAFVILQLFAGMAVYTIKNLCVSRLSGKLR